MKDIETIILNSFSQEPIYYLVSEVDSDKEIEYPRGIIEAKFEEDCVSKIEECIKECTFCKEVIDIDFQDGDDESFASYEITYLTKDGEEEIRYYELVVHTMFK